jgi:hypothetical protein
LGNDLFAGSGDDASDVVVLLVLGFGSCLLPLAYFRHAAGNNNIAEKKNRVVRESFPVFMMMILRDSKLSIKHP